MPPLVDIWSRFAVSPLEELGSVEWPSVKVTRPTIMELRSIEWSPLDVLLGLPLVHDVVVLDGSIVDVPVLDVPRLDTSWTLNILRLKASIRYHRLLDDAFDYDRLWRLSKAVGDAKAFCDGILFPGLVCRSDRIVCSNDTRDVWHIRPLLNRWYPSKCIAQTATRRVRSTFQIVLGPVSAATAYGTFAVFPVASRSGADACTLGTTRGIGGVGIVIGLRGTR